MRQAEDKQLRDFEIRQWFFLLRNQYISEGMSPAGASEQACDDIGMRYCLRKTSIRKARNSITRSPQERIRLMFEIRNNLERFKKIISRLDNALNEH